MNYYNITVFQQFVFDFANLSQRFQTKYFFFSFMHFGLYTRATSGLLRGSWCSNTRMCVYMTLTNFKGSIYIVQISAFNNSQSRNMKRIPMWKKSNEDTKGLTRILCNPLLRVKLKQVMAWLHVACVAGLQRGGRGKVECKHEARREREARSLGNFPPPSPLYAGHAG